MSFALCVPEALREIILPANDKTDNESFSGWIGHWLEEGEEKS